MPKKKHHKQLPSLGASSGPPEPGVRPVAVPRAGLSQEGPGPKRAWFPAICALLAALCSGWLVSLKWRLLGQGIGCGVDLGWGADGCQIALQGPWSTWFGLPAALPAAGLYGGLFGLLAFSGRAGLHRPLWVTAGSLVAVGAGIWFTGLMFWKGHLCPICLGTHCLGLLLAVSLWTSVQRGGWLRQGRTWALAAAGLGLLGVGQWLTPAPPPAPVSTIAEALLDGFDFPLSEVPHETSGSSQHVLVEYFDYTCPACRDMAEDLTALKARHAGAFTVVYLPCPLHPDCNPRLPKEVTPHDKACEFAKISLAVWRKAPRHWLSLHRQLFDLARSHNDTQARQMAASILESPEALDEALRDPWIAQRLAATAEQYGKLVTQDIRMPKLIYLKNRTMHGTESSTGAFVERLEQELGLPFSVNYSNLLSR